MLSRFTRFLGGTTGPRHPSVVLILVPEPEQTYALHIVPEDGTTVERIDSWSPKATRFRCGGTKELSREQLGTVLLHAADRPSQFLNEVSVQVIQILSARREKASGGEGGVSAVDHALRSAALDSLRKRGRGESQVDAAQSYAIFLVSVDRPKPGKIWGDSQLRSITHW